jgi:hypothetical protein
MILYCVIKKPEETEDEPVAVFTDQRGAYNYKQDHDPDGEKELVIYPVEI